MPIIGPFSASRGLNSAASNFSVPADQAVDLYNAVPRYEALVNRGSCIKVNASALTNSESIIGIGSFLDPAQAAVSSRSPVVVVVAGTGGTAKKVYTGPYTGPITAGVGAITFTDRTGALTLSNTVSTNVWQFATLNGVFVGVGNSTQSDPPFQLTTYNGNVAALAGSPPFASCVHVVNNFMFLAGNYSSSTTLSRVYWCSVGDPQTWPAANFIDVRVNDGDYISGLSSIGQDLIIFKTRSTHRLSTTTTAVSGTVTLAPLTTVSDSIGCLVPDTVKKLPDGRLVLFDQNGRLLIFDGATFRDVTNQPSPEPNVYYSGTATTFGGVSFGGASWSPGINQLATMAVHPPTTSVYIGAPTATENYVYNYLENSWTLLSYSSFAPNVLYSLPSAQGLTSTYPTLLGATAIGFIYSLEGTGSPAFIGANGRAPLVKMSIKIPADFVPRTIIIPATLESGASLTVTIGFNGTMNSTASTAIAATKNPLWNLVDVRQNVNSSGRPITMQVQIEVTVAKTFSLYPFIISDEVLSNFS